MIEELSHTFEAHELGVVPPPGVVVEHLWRVLRADEEVVVPDSAVLVVTGLRIHDVHPQRLDGQNFWPVSASTNPKWDIPSAFDFSMDSGVTPNQ